METETEKQLREENRILRDALRWFARPEVYRVLSSDKHKEELRKSFAKIAKDALEEAGGNEQL